MWECYPEEYIPTRITKDELAVAWIQQGGRNLCKVFKNWMREGGEKRETKKERERDFGVTADRCLKFKEWLTPSNSECAVFEDESLS